MKQIMMMPLPIALFVVLPYCGACTLLVDDLKVAEKTSGTGAGDDVERTVMTLTIYQYHLIPNGG
jgi:hypothetical protein